MELGGKHIFSAYGRGEFLYVIGTTGDDFWTRCIHKVAMHKIKVRAGWDPSSQKMRICPIHLVPSHMRDFL